MNNTPHITNTPSQSSKGLSLTLSITISTPFISDGTASPPPTVSTEGTVQSSTVSNTLAAVISTVFILLVVAILVILIVSVLVCRRRWCKTSNGNNTFSSDERKTDIDQQSDGNVYYSV